MIISNISIHDYLKYYYLEISRKGSQKKRKIHILKFKMLHFLGPFVNSDFSVQNHLRSNSNVLKMGWRVKIDIVGQAKHSLWGFNVKIGKYLPKPCLG